MEKPTQMKLNDVFHSNDLHVHKFEKWDLPMGWWSRQYEYPWAYQFMDKGDIVADMGCGNTFRPFKNALALKANIVYAIDIKPLEDKNNLPSNIEFIQESFTNTSLPSNSLDKVFCISVLEDLKADQLGQALVEFRRVVTPGGIIILTFDLKYDITRPLGKYPAVHFNRFKAEVMGAGLGFVGSNSQFDKTDAIYHKEHNLCVYHCVLECKS